MIAFLGFIEGGGYRSESTTISGRLLAAAWCFACMILSASYTANLASVLLADQQQPPNMLTTTSFDDLISNRLPVCSA